MYVKRRIYQKAVLWNCQDFTNASSKSVKSTPIDAAHGITCVSWAPNGKLFLLGTESGSVSVWTHTGKKQHIWQAHVSSCVNSVRINAKHDLVLSGSMDDVCVYSLGNKCAQLTCWNRTEVTALTWIDNDSFIVGEASGMITIDKAYQTCFRKVGLYYNNICTTYFYNKL